MSRLFLFHSTRSNLNQKFNQLKLLIILGLTIPSIYSFAAKNKSKPAAVLTRNSVSENEVVYRLPVAPVQAGQQNHRALISMESLQYPTPVNSSDRLNTNQMLDSQLIYKYQASRWEAAIDTSGGKSTNLNYSYLSVQELYSTLVLDPQVSATVGRKIRNWNQADDHWDLGLWQPLFQHDGLRSRKQGLTGLFVQTQMSNFELEGFVTPIFVPTMTPDLAEKNGEIVSESRWFRSLPTSSPLLGRDTRLVYKISTPDKADLVKNPGYGFRMKAGSPENYVQLSYAKKPVNTLSYKYDATIKAASMTAGQVELSPVVHIHSIWGLDYYTEVSSVKLGASYTADSPDYKEVVNQKNTQGFNTEYVMQQLRPIRAFSVFASTQVKLPLFHYIADMQIDYLKLDSADSYDVDSKGIEQTRLIPERANFTNAVSVSGQIPISFKWKTRGKYTRDFDQQGSLLSLAIDYQPITNWTLTFGGDSLGVDDENQTSGFLSRYRQNDRWYAGASYVF